MALVKTIKKSNGKNKKVDTGEAGSIVARRKKKVYEAHKRKQVYTYILKDITRDIYKIGKTTNPHDRFKNLCKRGKVIPVAVVKKDIEDILHKEYAENRIHNDEYEKNGATEWFERGGKFDAFIDKVDTGKYMPYITLHQLAKILEERGKLTIVDPTTKWELEQSKYSHYMIGNEIARMLGYIARAGSSITTPYPEDVFIIGQRVALSESIVDNILKEYEIFIGQDHMHGALSEKKDREKFDTRVRKVTIENKEFDSAVFLLLNKVL